MKDLLFLIFLLPATILGSFGAIYLKKGSSKLKFKLKLLIRNTHLILGVLLYGASMIFYLPALHLADVSIVYPLSSLTYIMISLLSTKLLGEKMSLKKWSGIILIITGSFLILQ